MTQRMICLFVEERSGLLKNKKLKRHRAGHQFLSDVIQPGTFHADVQLLLSDLY